MPFVRVLAAGSAFALLPLRVVRAVLAAPRSTADHPCSRELSRLLDDGYVVEAYRQSREPLETRVMLSRSDDVREITSGDLAFAAFAAAVVPRARRDSTGHGNTRMAGAA